MDVTWLISSGRKLSEEALVSGELDGSSVMVSVMVGVGVQSFSFPSFFFIFWYVAI